MVPSGTAPRQVLIWSVPTLVILLSLVWYRRKRNTLRTDPGGTSDLATKAKETNGVAFRAKPDPAPVVNEPQIASAPVAVPTPDVQPPALAAQEEASVQKECRLEEAVVDKKYHVEEAIVQERCHVEEAVVEKCGAEEPSVDDKCEVEEASVDGKCEVEDPSVDKCGASVDEKCGVEEESVDKCEVEEASVECEVREASVPDKCEEEPSVDEKCEAKEASIQECPVEVVSVEEKCQVEALSVKEELEAKASEVEAVKAQGSEAPSTSEMREEGVAVEAGDAAATAAATAAAGAAATAASGVASTVSKGSSGQKVASLGGKLASLSLEEQRSDADRDSANPSPVDVMLASPSLSNYSDEHSEGSSDSGKGCSDVASPPSRTPLGGSSLAGDAEPEADADVRIVYEFLLPQVLVGRLIGLQGSFVHEIKSKTNASVYVKKHPDTFKFKIVLVEGTQSEVDAALALIRKKYPLRKYPAVTLEQVSILTNAHPTYALIPEYIQTHLVEGVNNDVMVSCLVSPGHMFLQQPYHPTFQYLNRLSLAMNSVYSQADAPPVPEPINVGSICVAPATDGWYRVQVVSLDDENHTCEVKFVDHGGYMTLNNSSLRQIHHDFMTLPFQAIECYLANIKPTGGSGVWSEEALRLVDELTRGQMLYAQVCDYTEYCIPLVYLYCYVNSLVVLINQELVARGLADLDNVAESTATEAVALLAAAAEMAPLAVTEQQDLAETPTQVEAV